MPLAALRIQIEIYENIHGWLLKKLKIILLVNWIGHTYLCKCHFSAAKCWNALKGVCLIPNVNRGVAGLWNFT